MDNMVVGFCLLSPPPSKEIHFFFIDFFIYL